MKKSIKIYLFGFLGNVLDHYELALYGLLIPVFAKIFFLDDSQVLSYIKSYAIFPLFLFSRLLGARYFGKLADKRNVSYILSFTLFGMSATAIVIGFLPTVESIGVFAPYCLFSLLMLQNFFAAGEKTGGMLYVLDNNTSKRGSIVNSIYEISTILGYMLASICVFILDDTIHSNWRYLYIFSALNAFLGFLVRKNLSMPNAAVKNISTDQNDFKNMAAVIFIICFSYVLYYNTMTLMNSWIPFITSISYARVLHMNIYLLIIDILFLPIAGYLGHKFGVQKIMHFSIYLNIFTAISLFYIFKVDSFLIIFIIRICLILPAVLFSATSSYYIYQKINAKGRFQKIAIAGVIGAHLGKTAPVITYLIYQKTQLIISPALPIIGWGALALYSLRVLGNRRSLDTQLSQEISP